ncbi:MAG TPA: phosphate signaling complex protein PhoU [archaeon]|nr:phosphate signaling complex protein PhoU [archaeon]
MSLHFQREIEKLKRKLLSLSTLVEENVYRAVKAVVEKNSALAQKAIDADFEIDHLEVDVEEDCLKILALYQPVAVDLRFIVAVLKMNNDLERIGDEAVNVAERAVYLATSGNVGIPFDLQGMAEKAQAMLKNSLDALVNRDTSLARKVCAADDEVDDINRQMYDKVKERIAGGKGDINAFLHLLSISRHVERIADLATNIAEDVIYMVEGVIVRHRIEDYTEQSK